MRHSVGTKKILGMAVCGCSLGWLVGLSVSPVLQVTLETLLGVLASALAALSGISFAHSQSPEQAEEDRKDTAQVGLSRIQVDTLPLAGFCLFLAIGASLGVFARTNALLGGSPDFFVHRWRDSGKSDVQLRSQLLQELHGSAVLDGTPSIKRSDADIANSNLPKSAPQACIMKCPPNTPNKSQTGNLANGTANDPRVAGLFVASVEDCDRMRLEHGTLLKSDLIASVPNLKLKFEHCSSDECVVLAKELVCKSVQ